MFGLFTLTKNRTLITEVLGTQRNHEYSIIPDHDSIKHFASCLFIAITVRCQKNKPKVDSSFNVALIRHNIFAIISFVMSRDMSCSTQALFDYLNASLFHQSMVCTVKPCLLQPTEYTL